jgi:hypothetical protein
VSVSVTNVATGKDVFLIDAIFAEENFAWKVNVPAGASSRPTSMPPPSSI